MGYPGIYALVRQVAQRLFLSKNEIASHGHAENWNCVCQDVVQEELLN